MSEINNQTLRIFISHKMPADTALAQELGEKLALFGGDRIVVVHGGQFPAGDTWRASIERELDAAHWVILLHTDREADWSFCMFECGYFRSRMKTIDTARLIPFCQEVRHVSEALKEFNVVHPDRESIAKLLKQIYWEEPWRLHKNLRESMIADTADEIVALYQGAQRVEENFDVATNLTLEIMLSEENCKQLKANRIPMDTAVTGTSDWQRLFGRLSSTGGWLWPQLTEGWPYRRVYEYLLAGMVNEALARRRPLGTLLRAPNSDELYRLTLRRYEIMKNKKHRFHFTAALLDLPFDLPLESRHKARESILYNLINLTWYFRKRIIDHLYNRVLEVQAMRDPDAATIADLYKEIGMELMQINAQATIRQIDNPLVLERALGPDDIETISLVDRSGAYAQYQMDVFSAIAEGANGIDKVAESLHKMASLNFEWYIRVAQDYANLARELQRPEAPRHQRKKQLAEAL